MSAGLSSLQLRVSEFVDEYGLEAPTHVRTLDLVSEAGELAKEVLYENIVGGLRVVATRDQDVR